MTTPLRPKLIDTADLRRSLSSDDGPLDEGLAGWAIETVSGRALAITGANWSEPTDVPAGAYAILGIAVRRLYTNPDRLNREAEGDYNFGIDPSMTRADIFTPNEEQSLREYAPGGVTHRGIGTLTTYRGDVHEPRTRYVPDGTRYGFPWY